MISVLFSWVMLAAGVVVTYLALDSEHHNKLLLSRNNWSSFWNGAVAASCSFLALTNLLVLMRGF